MRAEIQNNRQRFLSACACRAVDRPPFWLMRQAGRALPEYRKLKEKYSFLELVRTPALAAEVTLQPVRRFGFDAAIVFSDILVIPEALGLPYRFRESGGVVMDFAVRTTADIERLSVEGVAERLAYVTDALRLVRQELDGKTALIGFAGSPWTLAEFMMEGGSAAKYHRAPALFREDRKAYCVLAEKLTAATVLYLRAQIAAGVDALQIFDSLGGLLTPADFHEASARWMRDIISGLCSAGTGPQPVRPPVIVFSPGTHNNWPDLVGTGAEVIGIDWRYPLARAREQLPSTIGLQGNLPPALLRDATPSDVAAETRKLLAAMRDRNGYIFNLGHGVPPDARLDCLESLADTVKEFK